MRALLAGLLYRRNKTRRGAVVASLAGAVVMALVSVPVNFKFAAERVNNFRPYVVAGAAPIFNLTTPKQKELRVNTFDMQIEIGLGCDIYLPFFKLIPELKFCFGVVDIINKNRNDLTDRYMYRFTQSVDRATSRSIALTFYFE